MRPNHNELRRARELVVPDVAEERTETFERAPDGVADDGGDERGEKRFDLEVVAVQNLRGEDGAAERGAEYCTRCPNRSHSPR